MKEFIEYFWFQEGYVYNEATTGLFDKYHFMMLLFGLIVYIILSLIGHKFKNKRNYLLVIGLILALLEILRTINYIAITDRSWLASMSFHLCAIGVYLAIIAGISKKNWMYELLFLHGIIGAPLALLIPFGILPWFNQYSFLALQSITSHVILTFFILYAWKNKLIKLSFKRYLIPVTGILISIITAYGMSIYNLNSGNGGQTNFFWTRYTDPVIDSFTSIEHPYVFMIIVGLLFTLGFMVYSLLLYIDLRKKNQM